ncbi:high-potential iron-sulfur protein [Ectothiorhodospira lacustris]|uniref:high-potential iron-sulfur protein n=1 Tax=Ectothiorhodospira lacustris TaxID=2899127 RepID=UPI001EE857DD|nr:high-potential iron-sulfur protein [Ectothiorhodospira lacustris]MCG5500585.1 high-potential iron-sulfur protein [Ectothiorhodospira lacustris]MCG5508778.1 high-potential iron-sulfur protein [Ectothiorhodospira lacustris]MCG5520569.1 high-potential iron-sulfur protein [Ectothiorhodospira lacustris]
MKTLNNNVSRRRFLQFGAYGLVAVPLAGALGWATAAQAADKVDESSDTAQALGYRHDAAGVDHPAFVEGSNCANCLLYTDTGGDWGPCAVFPGQQVAAKGWCTAWVARS